MKKYALLLLDNDDTENFLVLCEKKSSLINMKRDVKSYVDLITGETIRPSSSLYKDCLTYSKEPRNISLEEAANLLLAIKNVRGESAYFNHVMNVKNKSISVVEPVLRKKGF